MKNDKAINDVQKIEDTCEHLNAVKVSAASKKKKKRRHRSFPEPV